MWVVNLIKSLNKDWYYAGSTNCVKRRIIEHNKGLVKSTKLYIPFQLVYIKYFDNESSARNYE